MEDLQYIANQVSKEILVGWIHTVQLALNQVNYMQ